MRRTIMAAGAAAIAAGALAWWALRSTPAGGERPAELAGRAAARRLPPVRRRLRDRPLPRVPEAAVEEPAVAPPAKPPAAVPTAAAPLREPRHRRPMAAAEAPQAPRPDGAPPAEIDWPRGRRGASEGGNRMAAPAPGPQAPESEDSELARRVGQLPPEAQGELLVALRRLRDSGALRDLSPAQLADIVEIMPDRMGVQEADRILRQHLGVGLGEFLQARLGPEWFQMVP